MIFFYFCEINFKGLHHLQRTEFNAKAGIVVEYNDEQDRYGIRLDEGLDILVKRANLQVLSLEDFASPTSSNFV